MRNRHGAVQGQAGPAGDRADPRPPARSSTLFWQGKADLGQRQPVRARLPVDRPVGPAAGARPRPGQAAARGRRLAERLQDEDERGQTVEVPQTRSSCRRLQEIGIEIDLVVQDPRVLRRRGVRQLALAGLDHGHRRLRPPRRAERVPAGAAHSDGHLERGALQEPDVRQPRRRSTSPRSTSRRSALAGPDPELLLDETPMIFAYFYEFLERERNERDRRRDHRDGPDVPRSGHRVRPGIPGERRARAAAGAAPARCRTWPASSSAGSASPSSRSAS